MAPSTPSPRLTEASKTRWRISRLSREVRMGCRVVLVILSRYWTFLAAIAGGFCGSGNLPVAHAFKQGNIVNQNGALTGNGQLRGAPFGAQRRHPLVDFTDAGLLLIGEQGAGAYKVTVVAFQEHFLLGVQSEVFYVVMKGPEPVEQRRIQVDIVVYGPITWAKPHAG